MPSQRHGDLSGLLVHLSAHRVEFILVGGLAAVAQGTPITTFDVDVVHRRTPENVDRLLAALAEVNARYRGRLDGQIIAPERGALLGAGHQLLMTDLGALDVLGAVERGLGFDDLRPFAAEVVLAGERLLVLRLEKLIELKEGSTREKDRAALAQMKAALALSRRSGAGGREPSG